MAPPHTPYCRLPVSTANVLAQWDSLTVVEPSSWHHTLHTADCQYQPLTSSHSGTLSPWWSPHRGATTHSILQRPRTVRLSHRGGALIVAPHTPYCRLPVSTANVLTQCDSLTVVELSSWHHHTLHTACCQCQPLTSSHSGSLSPNSTFYKV